MSNVLKNPVVWWLALIGAVTLPFSVTIAIEYLGGYFADYIYRSAYQLISFALCWAGIFFALKLLNAPQRLKALRVAGMISISTFLALGSCVSMISSSCQSEFIELKKLGVQAPSQVAAKVQELESESCS